MPPETSANDLAAVPATGDATPLTKYWFWIVLLLVCWQPLEIGFYMDDWSAQADAATKGAAFSSQRFQANLAVDPSRPAAAVIRFVFSSLLGGRPILWQLAMLLSNALVAVWLARASQAILGLNRRGSDPDPAALSVTLLWLLLPWSTASQFWTIMFPESVVATLFAYLITRIFERKSNTFASSIVDALIYLFICLSYEAFYGQFVAVVALCIALAVLGRMRPQAAVFNLLSLGTAQVVAFGWYFASAKVTSSHRGIEPGATALIFKNLAKIAPLMLTSAEEMRWELSVSFLSLLIWVGFIFWRSRRRWADSRPIILGSILIAMACGLGAAISVASFSLGGRPFTPFGINNRVLLLVSFWLLLLTALAALAVQPLAGMREIRVLGWFALVCGLIVGLAHTVRALDWANAWIQEQEILRTAPVDQMKGMEADAAVVLVNPLNVKDVPIFAAWWDINAALPLTYSVLRNRTITVYSPWRGPMSWDGNILAFAGEAPVATTHHVYLWIPADHSFRRAERPFQVGLNLSVSDLP